MSADFKYSISKFTLIFLILAFLNVGCDGTINKQEKNRIKVSDRPSKLINEKPDNSITLTYKGQYNLKNQTLKSGIPFPLGLVKSLDDIRVVSTSNLDEYNTQVNSLARWPDGSVKSALIQFQDNLSATEKNYYLLYGNKSTRRNLDNGIKLIQSKNKLTIDTGKIKFELAKKTGLINALWRDSNGDKTYQASEKSVQGSELYMVNAFNQQEYTSRSHAKTILTIEEKGPVRVVIKIVGALRNTSNQTLMKYQLRYYVYLNSDQIDMDYTVIDDRLETNVRKPGKNLAISATSYGMRIHYTKHAANYRFGGAEEKVYEGAVNGEHYLYQAGEFRYDSVSNSNGKKKGRDLGHRFNYSGVGVGDRASGWLSVDTNKHHIVAMVRDFWQQYPNEMRVNNSTLTLALHPGRANEGMSETRPPAQSGSRYKRAKSFYFKRKGGAKTYQLQFLFPANRLDNNLLQAHNNQLNTHKLNLMAAPQWYVDSGVFGNMNLGTDSNDSSGYDAYLMHDIFLRSSRGTPETAGRNINMYSWRDYGDRLRAGWEASSNGVRIPSFYNDTHVGANNFFKEFLRTGDQRWFGLAEISTRHFMDIDVTHGPRKGKWKTGRKVQPAGEIHAIKHSMVDHETRNVHPGHAHVSGLSDYYLLTGDYRSKEVLREIVDWWAFMRPYMFEMPFNFADDYREAERDFGWPLYVMTEQSRVFGDEKYHQNTTAKLVNYLIQWWQTPKQHIGYNTETENYGIVGINDASKGTGYWTMTRMDNKGKIKNANGTNPWMAGSLISNLIAFYEQDKIYKASNKGSKVNHKLLKDMLFQTMNYIVKYGYIEKSGKMQGKFVYSEVVRKYGGGHNHIVYGLAYLDKLYKAELSKNNIAHPEWYETQKIWREIAVNALENYVDRNVGQNNQSYGFYGYEIVFPLDYFKLMEE